MSLLVVAASIVGALGGLGGLAAVIRAFAHRPSLRADAEVKLSDETRQWVEQFQESAREAGIEAREARKEAAEARREATDARREVAETQAQVRVAHAMADDLVKYLRWLFKTIHDPRMDIDRLRELVGDGPNLPNGRG